MKEGAAVPHFIEGLEEVAVAMLDRTGHVTSWNAGARRLFGHDASEAIGKHLSHWYPLDQFELGTPKDDLATAASLGMLECESWRLRKDGTSVRVGMLLGALRAPGGELTGFGQMLQELDRAPAREALYGFLEAAPDAVVIVDQQGRILLVNSQTERIFGYSRSELVGLPVEVLVPERFRSGHPEHRARYLREPKVRSMGTGLALFALRRDGTEFPVEISLSSLKTELGTVVASTIRDVTERKSSEERFRGLLEAASDAMVIVDRTGTIVLVNAQTERLFGYHRDQLLGHSVELLVPERFRAGHGVHRADYHGSPKTRPMGSGRELYGRRSDGSEFPVEIGLSPLKTAEGTLVSSTIRDITPRMRVETALKNANRELETFSYSVAHDLRAPLRGMNGFAQVLLDDYGTKLDASGQDCLREIQSAAVRMGLLIDALLSLSRVARSKLRLERVSLSRLVQETAARFAASEPGRQVTLTVQEGLEADVDPQLAQTLIDNLLANAWKFTRNVPSPRVAFGTTLQDGTTAFYVRDNGAGFSMNFAAKLFQPFQRLHTVSEFPGTGIGLATAQRIVHRHGGKIWASGSVDQGATFYFTFSPQAVGEPA